MAAGDVTSVVVQLTDGLASIATQIEAIMNAAGDTLTVTPTGAEGEFLVLSVEQA